MTIKTKNIAIAALTAVILASGVMATANAAQNDISTGSFTAYRGDKEKKGIATKKTTLTGTSATITFDSNIPANDQLDVYIRNQNDNVVSATGHWRNVSKGTPEHLMYLEGKGKQGNTFYPCFYLHQSSQSSSLWVSYTFEP